MPGYVWLVALLCALFFAPLTIGLFALSLMMTISKAKDYRAGRAGFPTLWLICACAMLVPALISLVAWLCYIASAVCSWMFPILGLR